MRRGNPEIAEAGKKSRWKALDGIEEKIGKKVFGVKLPLSYEEKMNSLSQKERVALMRRALIEALDEVASTENEKYENN